MRPPDLSYLTDVWFGCGAVGSVPGILERLGIARPLVVTDANLLERGFVARLGLDEPTCFSGTATNPTEANLNDCLAQYRARDCDGLVALGGGAPMDLAKLVALMASHPAPLAQYAILEGGVEKIRDALPPVVAVPTTAGSGSEVGRAALLKLDSGRKLGFLSPHLLPKAAVCDPELTLSVPPALTAATGMDALSHCVEAYCSPRPNAVADAIALDGLARGWQAIGRAHADGADRAAREEMMHCALMGGLAFQKGLGAVHSLSHPLGASAGLHHGTLNALFLAPVLRFNAAHCAAKLERMAHSLELRAASEVADAFDGLVMQLGLPRRLRDLGVEREALPSLARHAAEDHCSATNPRPLDAAAALRLYEEAW
jgi:alcohol dehydrogenase class IV